MNPEAAPTTDEVETFKPSYIPKGAEGLAPEVIAAMETDITSENYGRIKDAKIAEGLARGREAEREEIRLRDADNPNHIYPDGKTLDEFVDHVNPFKYSEVGANIAGPNIDAVFEKHKAEWDGLTKEEKIEYAMDSTHDNEAVSELDKIERDARQVEDTQRVQRHLGEKEAA